MQQQKAIKYSSSFLDVPKPATTAIDSSAYYKSKESLEKSPLRDDGSDLSSNASVTYIDGQIVKKSPKKRVVRKIKKTSSS